MHKQINIDTYIHIGRENKNIHRCLIKINIQTEKLYTAYNYANIERITKYQMEIKASLSFESVFNFVTRINI